MFVGIVRKHKQQVQWRFNSGSLELLVQAAPSIAPARPRVTLYRLYRQEDNNTAYRINENGSRSSNTVRFTLILGSTTRS